MIAKHLAQIDFDGTAKGRQWNIIDKVLKRIFAGIADRFHRPKDP